MTLRLPNARVIRCEPPPLADSVLGLSSELPAR